MKLRSTTRLLRADRATLYLGQQDAQLRYRPADLVAREEVADYSTDFSPMHDKDIETLTARRRVGPLKCTIGARKYSRGTIPKWLGFRSCARVREAGGNSSVVEHDLAKVGVAGSNPVSRSIPSTVSPGLTSGRRSQVAKAEVCKTSIQRFESARRLHTHQRTHHGESPLEESAALR